MKLIYKEINVPLIADYYPPMFGYIRWWLQTTSKLLRLSSYGGEFTPDPFRTGGKIGN